MHTPATTIYSTSTPSVTALSTGTSPYKRALVDTPDRWPAQVMRGSLVQAGPTPMKPKGPANDFHLDTLFNPVWMSGPHVFSFAPGGTVVHPETFAPEPYLGYHADRARRLDSGSAGAGTARSRGVLRDPKPWKNVAITEQDDAEYEELMERTRMESECQ